MKNIRDSAYLYRQFDADLALDVSAEGYRGWKLGILIVILLASAACLNGCLGATSENLFVTESCETRESIALECGMNSAEVSVDISQRFQEIDCFGASDCWSMQKIGAWSEESRNKVADLLFSVTEGIGLSCWRFNLGAGLAPERIHHPWRSAETFEVSQGEYDWTRQVEERWFLAAAKSHGVPQFVAFACSPPSRITRSGFPNCDDGPGSTNLKDGHEKQFAQYLADILEHFRDNPDEKERLEFDWVSPVNEPEWEWNKSNQEGCRASNEDIKALILALDEELRKRRLKTKILVPESGALQDMLRQQVNMTKKYGKVYGDYLEAFCGDPQMNAKLGNTICAHSYWNDILESRLTNTRAEFQKKLAEYPGWKYWQTEYCVMQGPHKEGGHGRDLGMETALNVARVIHYDLTLANASSWSWWLAVSESDYKDGLIYTDYRNPGDEETIYPSKLLWSMGNFSRFIRPGFRRVAVEGAEDINGLLGSAYVDEMGEGLVTVLINMSETAIPVRLTFKGISEGSRVGELIPYITSEKEGDDLAESPAVNSKEPLSIPARSVVTVLGKNTNESR